MVVVSILDIDSFAEIATVSMLMLLYFQLGKIIIKNEFRIFKKNMMYFMS